MGREHSGVVDNDLLVSPVRAAGQEYYIGMNAFYLLHFFSGYLIGVAPDYLCSCTQGGQICRLTTVFRDKAGNLIRDSAVRPNQIFAVSLPFTFLPRNKEKAIVERVEQDLLTPFGLRTLSKEHPAYIGRYMGGPRSRDLAYHNGTVWPWLLGPYVTAYLKVRRNSKESLENMRADMQTILKNFDKNLESGGIGTIPEVFDGDYPYNSGGCIAQAWSVAEVLRAYVEDVLGIKP